MQVDHTLHKSWTASNICNKDYNSKAANQNAIYRSFYLFSDLIGQTRKEKKSLRR